MVKLPPERPLANDKLPVRSVLRERLLLFALSPMLTPVLLKNCWDSRLVESKLGLRAIILSLISF